MPGFAYSVKYTAAPIPIGVAIISVITIMYNVFTMLPRIPNVPSRVDGIVDRNCQLIEETPLKAT